MGWEAGRLDGWEAGRFGGWEAGGGREEEEEEQDGAIFLILKDFERKWRLGRKKGEEEEGGSPMELFGGLISEVKNTVFTYIYIYICENGTFWNSQNLTRHAECC